MPFLPSPRCTGKTYLGAITEVGDVLPGYVPRDIIHSYVRLVQPSEKIRKPDGIRVQRVAPANLEVFHKLVGLLGRQPEWVADAVRRVVSSSILEP